ncbi:hypothetical protein LSH36_110g03019 [Paralvinella palmiformis]|uniref:Uncharacterized protein n=1 Tax=Paralvinella palmiformis TaxID=53620 RepID=A0AAD9NB67_9ANNE|nr:hypothetical protein LSH36_110g03019 [Paralvinella palmiformis]
MGVIHPNQITAYYRKQPTELVKSYKYPGVVIGDQLHFISHIKYIKEKLTSRLNMLKIIDNTSKGVSTSMILSLHRALIKTVLTYSTPVLLMASTSAIGQIDIIQRAPLLFSLGIPRPIPTALIYTEAGEPHIKAEIKRTIINYIIRVTARPQPTLIMRSRRIVEFPPVTWPLKAAGFQEDFPISLIHPHLVLSKPPLLLPPFDVYIYRDHSNKDDPIATLTPWLYFSSYRNTPLRPPETAHQVWDEAEHLKQLTSQIIFHWMPSHVAISATKKLINFPILPQPLTLSIYVSTPSEL